MKVVDFKGNKYTWPPTGHIVDNDETRPRSELHKTVRDLLKDRYPLDPILEEVPMPGTRMFLDFYLPRRCLAIECQGRQHFEQINHFHKDQLGFIKSQVRDKTKEEWCELNNIALVVINYNDHIEEIKIKI